MRLGFLDMLRVVLGAHTRAPLSVLRGSGVTDGTRRDAEGGFVVETAAATQGGTRESLSMRLGFLDMLRVVLGAHTRAP